MGANVVSIFALLIWPLISWRLYRTLPVAQATIWSILGAYMLLPVAVAIDFPMIPPLDKRSIPNLAAFVACSIVMRRRVRFSNGFGLIELLLLTYVISPFITAYMNNDTIEHGETILPALTTYDALSSVVQQVLFILPFALGRQLLSDEKDIETMLRALVVATLAYSLPVLFEIRMSPQLHTWIYGFFPHSFAQQMREGGFRAVVFMGHGLLVAFFMMSGFVAAAAFQLTRTTVTRWPAAPVTAFLGLVLLMCKTLGALLYGVMIVPLLAFFKPKFQLTVASALVIVALIYPALRIADYFPVKGALEFAEAISDERAKSLKFRFDNEDVLLEHAMKRLPFGWGMWGRNRVYDDFTGDDITVTDGHWIITLGAFGILGFVAEFGLLILPVLRASSGLTYLSGYKEKIYFSALTLILTTNIVDLIPNASISPWTWLMAGAVLGRVERAKKQAQTGH